ncbi:MAG: site-2 protease family protein [Chloroflexi bacterium]|nr:site-2 protease family protein [Chloroflexota bacterium]
MIFDKLHLLGSNPLEFFRMLALSALALAVAITIHEFSHAYIAFRLGDPTAQSQGRISLNPVRHLDPLGTILLFVAGFGWGKPVPVNPYYLKHGPRKGMALVALAGPVSNLLLAAALGPVLRLAPLALETFFEYAFIYNIVLAIFNLLPVPPLDGSNILMGILPSGLAASYSRVMPFGPAILLGVIMIDRFTPGSILGSVMGPPMQFFANLFLGQMPL